MNILLHIAYRQDNIQRMPIDDIIDSVTSMTYGEMGFVIVSLILLGYCIFLIINRRRCLPKSGTIKYLSGYPIFYEPKNGVVEIKGDNVIFKDFLGDEVFFSIPLRQITQVTTRQGQMSALAYLSLGPFAGLSSHNYLIITFKHDGKEYSVEFYAHRESFINRKLKKEIDEAIKSLK